MDYVVENGKIWDNRAESNDKWSTPVTSEMIQLAKNDNWSIVLTPSKPVPRGWFPEVIKIKKGIMFSWRWWTARTYYSSIGC